MSEQPSGVLEKAPSAGDLTEAGYDGPDLTLKRYPWRSRVTPWSRIINHEYKGSGTEEDPYVVLWLENDEEDPLNFSAKKKWLLTLLVATGTLAVGFGSSMLSAAIANLRIAFPGENSMLYTMITGCFVLGFVVGPLLWAPCSEVFGRRLIFVISYIPFTAFNAGVCGAKSLNAMLVLRFFAGTFGSSAMTNSGGVIADLFTAKDRGMAMGVFALMPFLGPSIGPVAGGFLSMKYKWEWTASVIAFFSAALTLITCVYLPETYAPVMLRARAKNLFEVTGKVYRCEQDVRNPLRTKELFLNQLRVPYVLLFTEPIVAVISLYMAVIYAILYMQFTAFPLVFQGYRGWNPGVAALAFIGVTVGAFIALTYLMFVDQPRYVRNLEKEGYATPEARLPSCIVGGIVLPVGLFIFAWTCVPVSIHWIAPIIATVPFGMGIVLLFLGLNSYLVDAYLMKAASVLAAGAVTRSILGVVFPLFTYDMYEALNPNWAGTLVACLALVFIPCPILLLFYGRRIRRMTQPGRDADDLGRMLAKLPHRGDAEAAAGTAAGTAAGAAAAAGADGPSGSTEELGDEDATTLGGRPQLYRTFSVESVESAEYAPVDPSIKSGHEHH